MNQELIGFVAFFAILMGIMVAGFAHMVGGSKWSGKVIGVQIRILRWLLGSPIIWAGMILLAIGKMVKGGKAPRLTQGQGNRRNSQNA